MANRLKSQVHDDIDVAIQAWEAPMIANAAWNDAATSSNISSGFAATGIFPFNRNFVSDNAQKFNGSVPFRRPQPDLQDAPNGNEGIYINCLWMTFYIVMFEQAN